ncbi:hypothetical protein CWI38_0308p0040 [Hamiltosporidium tvaerminnensis]|uniref:SP-RING-type domain-containing protein n=1 Tax=Hamiltosporidium tvaerminnensis TaxID=1176355 RepID=A0A4Q9LZN1_9MICR|nr:hypothetical protein CWI38_0308p0040 [Hamiltosporidium tvaerminnensis]
MEESILERIRLLEEILKEVKDKETVKEILSQKYLMLNSENVYKHINNEQNVDRFDEQKIKNSSKKDLTKYLYSVIEKSREYKNVVENFKECGIEISGIKSNNVCPITLKKIVDLYVGECGHKFERIAVSELRKQNRICPVVGCSKVLREKVERNE